VREEVRRKREGSWNHEGTSAVEKVLGQEV